MQEGNFWENRIRVKNKLDNVKTVLVKAVRAVVVSKAKICVICLLIPHLTICQVFISNDMDKELCSALIEKNEVKLASIFNKKFLTLDNSLGPAENFELIKEWLEDYDCISSVKLNPGMLRTEPPVKEVVIFLKGSDESYRSVGIQVFKNEFRFR